MTGLFCKLCELIEADEPCALATVVAAKGSTPQKAGAKAIFMADGRIFGTLGGGCLEAESRQRALRALQTRQRQLFKLVLNDDFGWDDGLICGGAVEVFVDPHPKENLATWRILSRYAKEPHLLRLNLKTGNATVENAKLMAAKPIKHQDEYLEPILPKERLIIAGAGHIGAALCKLAASIDFSVTVIDDRFTYANRERLPDAEEIIVDEPAAAIARMPLDYNSYVVIVTRGHRHDATVLREVIGKPSAYIGMIGSKRKVRIIFEQFLEQGVATDAQLKRVHSPVGLDIGAESVEEIAVSIAAQLIQARAALRERL